MNLKQSTGTDMYVQYIGGGGGGACFPQPWLSVFTSDLLCHVTQCNTALLFLIDPYHSAAMLSLGGIKSFVFARQASARREFSARHKNKAFYSPETQHGRCVIKVYCPNSTVSQVPFIAIFPPPHPRFSSFLKLFSCMRQFPQ